MDNLVNEIHQRPLKPNAVRQQSLQDPVRQQPGYPDPARHSYQDPSRHPDPVMQKYPDPVMQKYPDTVRQPSNPDPPRKQYKIRQQSFQDPDELEEPLMDIEERILMARRASEPPDARKAVMGEFARLKF